jgi:fimbrial chaperone protein
MRLFAPHVFAFAFAFADPCVAASLQVTPVTLEIGAPGSTAVLNLRNSADRPLNAQARIFRWRQIDGKDELTPTDSVVVSPPVAEIGGNESYAIRVVRTDPTPVSEPESYRLLIDELPDAGAQRSGTINLVLRYSIPVFFTAPEGEDPKLFWSVRRTNGRLAVALRNDGDRHIRISALKLRDKSGGAVFFGPGLVGYALGRSSVEWTSPPAKRFGAGGAEVSAQSDLGEIHASASAER